MTDDFRKYLRLELNRSGNTAEAYLRDILQFACWLGCDAADLLVPGNVEPNDIRDWLGSLASDSVKAASLRRKTQSIRAFFRWGMITGRISGNPAAEVSLAKLPKRLPDIVKPAEIEEIIKEYPDTSPHDNRVRLALELLYGLGLRQAELLQIDDSDIHRSADGAELRVIGKGNKERVLPIPEPLMDKIKKWQTVRDAHFPDLPVPAPLMADRHGRIAKRTLYRDIHQALLTTSATRKSPHTLRHSFATAMLADGANLDAVRQLLGHASLATTQIYTHLSPRELRHVYDMAHPRAAHNPNDNKNGNRK